MNIGKLHVHMPRNSNQVNEDEHRYVKSKMSIGKSYPLRNGNQVKEDEYR